MFREYFILLLLGHILGDFYIQTNKISEKKVKSVKWLAIHCLCYWGIMIFISLPILSYEIALAATMAAILHFIIDMFKFLYLPLLIKKAQNTQVLERNIFFIDQIFHISHF